MTGGDNVTYDAPPPVEFETEEADFRLADGILTCRMKISFAAEDQARAVIEQVLRAWDVNAELRLGMGGLRFQFKSAEVIDRTPATPGIHHASARLRGSAGTLSASATVVPVLRQEYPAPPGHFRITLDVEVSVASVSRVS